MDASPADEQTPASPEDFRESPEPPVAPDPESPEEEPEPEPEPEETGESFIRHIPGGAGHGPARAHGYIALAKAFGAEASLTKGGTRSTSRHPLEVTVKTDAGTFARINAMYDEVSPVAEQVAAQRRAEFRQVKKNGPTYEVSLLTRAILAGFPEGAASALREPGTTKPDPFREATRARLVNTEAHRSAIASGRAWARSHLRQREGA